MNKLWFKAKTYGWGWYPSSWQGWLVLLIYLAITIFIFRATDLNSHSASDTILAFFLPFIILTAMLIAICYLKGEKPRWRWGN